MECSNGGNVMTGRDTILIVDDMEINRVILRGVFEADYNFLEAENRQSGMISEFPVIVIAAEDSVQNIIELNQHRLNQEALIGEQHTRRTMEIFKTVMNVWTEADASLIQWGEKDACMLSCHDITRYK